MACAGGAAAAAIAGAIKYCRYCGCQLDVSAKYCPECGREVPKPSNYVMGAIIAFITVSMIIFFLFILN
jgi:predicted amidophosphoribosyltransferase